MVRSQGLSVSGKSYTCSVGYNLFALEKFAALPTKPNVVALTQTPLKIKPWKSPLGTGVYMIRNKVNGKVYIGSSAKSIKRRLVVHRNELRGSTHNNSRLQRAWRKYGEENFEFVVLCNCDPNWCLCMEQIFIRKFDSSNRLVGYNILPNAGSNLGIVRTAEQNMRSSIALSAFHKKNPHVGRLISEKTKGIKRKPEHIEKSRQGLLAIPPRIRSEIAKRLWSERPEELKKRMMELARTPEAIEKHRMALVEVAKKMTREDWAKVTGPRWTGNARQEMSEKIRAYQSRRPQSHNDAIKRALARPEAVAKMRAFNQSPDWKETQRKRAIELWKNPEYRRKRAATIKMKREAKNGTA